MVSDVILGEGKGEAAKGDVQIDIVQSTGIVRISLVGSTFVRASEGILYP